VASSVAFSVLLVAFAFVRVVWLACVVLLAVGFTMILNGALCNALLQAIVPDALRGRLMAAYSFVVVGMAQVVGAFCGGAVARAVGETWAIGGGAFWSSAGRARGASPTRASSTGSTKRRATGRGGAARSGGFGSIR